MRAILAIILLATFTHHAGAAVFHVPADQPTIQAGIDAALDGDLVIVACGTYFEYDIAMKSGVTLTSATGLADCVTIDAQQQGRVFLCVDLSASTRIAGFTITGGQATIGGGGMYCSNAFHEIDNCLFSGNQANTGAGIHSTNSSDLTITNCSFDGNVANSTGGGIWSTQYNTITLTNCTFTGNEAVQAGGLGSNSLTVTTLSNCTFRDNSGSFQGGGIWAWYANVTLDNCIIAGSSAGEAIFRGNSTLSISCTDIFGNAGGDWIGDIAAMVDVDGNFSADPQFCGISGSGNVYLQSDSPCAPGNHPVGAACDLIGAMPVICAGTATEAITWSRMKSMY